jgi:hypothetical protein
MLHGINMEAIMNVKDLFCRQGGPGPKDNRNQGIFSLAALQAVEVGGRSQKVGRGVTPDEGRSQKEEGGRNW